MRLAPPIAGAVCAVMFLVLPVAFAQGGVQEGLSALEGKVDVMTDVDARETIGNTVRFAVTYVALAAIIAVIAVGFVFILGFGGDSSVQRGKKMLIYAVVGIVVIFFARVIVGFFTEEIPSEIIP